MKILFITLLFVLGQNLLGQANWSFDQKVDFNRFITYEGVIDKTHQINMYFKESYEACSDNSRNRTDRIVYGWYQYNKAGKKVPLVGYVCQDNACKNLVELFVPIDPINYSFDENCRLIEAKESFKQERGWQSDRFERQTDDDQKHPVSLKPIHKFSWLTKATILFNINGVEIETFNLTELTQNNYIESIEIIGVKRMGTTFHLLIKYSHQSKPGSYGKGMCGNGIEEFIAHLVINNDFEVESFERKQLRSCIYNIDNVDVSFDANQPELGIESKNKKQ
ncbi:hypothetical protein [Marixanthomonas ophiurae]|uniref:Uncharacterized protein n=1 Tax=Marixanthomonas ophiurae TaxID=387659 RepID=A0A3E1Q7S9_9FLAO|nr:hypothetical protein [Marixanthomonas ophiurae]RFN58174.1 hypothetical protein DZ858_13150 [Marixanthomonas ophiurae]